MKDHMLMLFVIALPAVALFLFWVDRKIANAGKRETQALFVKKMQQAKQKLKQ